MSDPVKIEVCRRAMDYFYDSSGDPQPKYHAQIKGCPGLWAAGFSIDDAIGNLVRCHPERFGVSIDYLEAVSR